MEKINRFFIIISHLIFWTALTASVGMPEPDSGVEVTIENINNVIYATRIQAGSNNQGGSSSHIMLDTTISGIYLTKSNVKNFDGDGLFNTKSSSTYDGDKST